MISKGTRSTHNTDAWKGRNSGQVQSQNPAQLPNDVASAHNNRGQYRDDLHSTASKNIASQLKAKRELAPLQNPKKQAQSLIQKKIKAKDLNSAQSYLQAQAEKTPD